METPGKTHDTISAEDVLLGLNRVFPIIKRLYGVRKIGIFGKFARRETENINRIELLVEFTRGYESYRSYLDLKKYLSEQFKTKVWLVTSRVYQEGEYTVQRGPGNPPEIGNPLPELVQYFETLRTKCDVTVEAFSRNAELRRFAEDCMETAALIIRSTDQQIKISGNRIPWTEIEEIGDDITDSGYQADPHLLWHYIHSEVPVILTNLYKLAGIARDTE